MKFSNGVYAQVTLRKEMVCDENNEIVASGSHYFYDSRDVYDFLIDIFPHEVCANAEAWTELASVGDFYENDDFEVEMMERD